MRNLAFILLAFGLLVFESALASLIPFESVAPNLLLPIVIYLGVTHDVHLVRGAALSFVLGYLLDSFCGSPMGLSTFVMVATYLLARGAGLRLFARGVLFQIALFFVVSLLAGGSVLALRAIFEPPPPFPAQDTFEGGVALALGSLVTALIGPLVFFAVRRIDGLITRRREEGAQAA